MPFDLSTLAEEQKVAITVKGGGYDLSSLEDKSMAYPVPKINPVSSKSEFQNWWNTNPSVVSWRDEFKKQYGEEPQQGGDYNYRGAFEAGIVPQPSKFDNKYHWDSIGLNGVDLKSENHPTRWKSEYMKATGNNPDENGISFTSAVMAVPSLEKYRPKVDNVNTEISHAQNLVSAEAIQAKNNIAATFAAPVGMAINTSPYVENAAAPPDNIASLMTDGTIKTAADRGEFQVRKLSKSIIGSTVQFLALMQDPTAMVRLTAPIVSKLTGQPESTTQALSTISPVQEWRDKQNESDIWLKNYNPNTVEDIAAFGMGVLVDLPIFGAFGKVGSTLWKAVPEAVTSAQAISYATKILAGAGSAMSKKLLLSGVKKEAADWAVHNAIANIALQVGEKSAATGISLAGHAATVNVLNQIQSGKSIEEIDLLETAKSGKNSLLLGAVVGPLGLAASQAGKYASGLVPATKPFLQTLVDKGIKFAGFESEVTAFTLGSKYLEGDKTPTTWGDIAKANIEFGLLHGFGVAELNKNPLSSKPELAYQRYKNFESTIPSKDELNSAGYESPESFWKAVEDGKINLRDKNIPGTLQAKIRYAQDPMWQSDQFDLTDKAVKVEAKTENGLSRMKTYDKEGSLLEVVTSEDPQIVKDHLQNVLDVIRRKEADNFISSDPGAEYKANVELKNKGYENGLASKDNTAWMKSPLERTVEETKHVDGIINIIEKVKKDIVKEQKQAKGEELKNKISDIEADKDNKLSKTDDKEKINDIKQQSASEIAVLKANNVENTDTALISAQKRLGLPTAPEVIISIDTESTFSKIEKGEPVINESLKLASNELYSNYKKLEVMKSSDIRKFTMEQIESKQKELGDKITELQDYTARQHEEGTFLTKEELKQKKESVNIIEPTPEKVPVNPEIPIENQQTTSKPIEESSQKVEPKVNIEAKKTDIEKKRQGELNELLPKEKISQGNLDFSAALTIGIPEFYQQLFDMARDGKNTIAGVKEKYAPLLQKLYNEGKLKDKKDVWLALNPKANKINAKYDAELNLLKTTESSPANIESAFTKGLGEADKFLADLEGQLDKFGQETLGVNIPVAVAKGAILAARGVVQTAKYASEVVDAAIKYVKETDWYKGLKDQEKIDAEDQLTKFFTTDAPMNEKIQPKQRMKLPSESPVKEVSLSEMAGLRDQLKLEVKSAVEAARSVKKSFKDIGNEIKDIFKNNASKEDKNLINPGQYRSITIKIANSTTDTKTEQLLDYVYKVIDGAEYKGALTTAKAISEGVKSMNTLSKGKFGKSKDVGDLFEKIDAKEMTIEELVAFNAMGHKLIVKGDIDIPRMNAMLIKFGDINKGRSKEELTDIETHDKLKTKIDNAVLKVEEIENLSTENFSMIDYMKTKKSISALRNKIGTLLQEGESVMSDAQAKLLNESLDALEKMNTKVAGEYETEAARAKTILIENAIADRSAGVDTKAIDKMEKQTRDLIYTLLNAKKNDIEALDIADIDSYSQFVANAKEGAFTTQSAALLEKITEKKIRRTYLDKAFEIYNKSKRGSNFRSGLNDKELLEYVRSLNPREIESKFGLLGTEDGFVRTLSDVGNAINASNNYKKAREEEFNKAQRGLLDGLKETGTKFPAKHKFSKQKEELEYMGMLMVEASARNPFKGTKDEVSLLDYMFGSNFETNKKNNSDKLEFASKKVIYDRLFSDAQKAGVTKIVNEKEIIDIDKFVSHIRIDKRRAKYLDDVRGIYASINGMAEAATMLNGRTYETQGETYMPLMRFGKAGFLHTEELNHTLNMGMTSPKMIANATNARLNRLFVVETNPSTINKVYLSEMTRNYFVLPQLRASSNALKGASLELSSKNEGLGSGENDIAQLGRILQEGLVDRAAFVLNGRRREMYSSAAKLYDKLLAAKKKALIANPNRVIAEVGSNTSRSIMSESLVSGSVKYGKNPDVYNSIIDTYFGDKHFSRWENEADANLFKTGAALKLERGATSLVTFSDTFVGKRFFAGLMAKEFEAKTGEEFDAERYGKGKADPYFDKVGEDVDHAASWALRKVEELFNSKNVMSQPEYTRFFGKAYDPTDVIVKTVDGLQGFNRNEWSQMHIAWRRFMDGETKEIWNRGLRDLVSIPVSNFLYMQTRLATNTGVKWAVQGMVLGQVDDNTKKKIDELGTLSAWGVNVGASVASLVMGGSQGLYKSASNLISLGMSAAKVENKTIDMILGWAENELYMTRIPANGSSKQIISSILPGPSSSMFNDGWDAVVSTAALMSAVNKAYEGSYITTDQYLKIANGFNMVMLYGMSNPASGWIQGQLSPMIKATSTPSKSEEGTGTGRQSLRQGGRQSLRQPQNKNNGTGERQKLRNN